MPVVAHWYQEWLYISGIAARYIVLIHNASAMLFVLRFQYIGMLISFRLVAEATPVSLHRRLADLMQISVEIH